MHNRTFAVALWLALSLAAAGSRAETPPAAAAPATANAVDPASIQALKAMGAYLQTLKRFQVTHALSGERVLADGQKLQHTARAELDVVRPDRIHVHMSSARAERELYYDGRQVTLYTPAQKYYSTVEFTGTLAALVGRLEAKYGVELPLADLFVWGTDAAPVDTIDSALSAGQDFIGDTLCEHYAFRQGDIDWQIWIQTGDRPLPRKLVITSRADEARPQSVSQIDWNLKPVFRDARFTFVPPKGSTAVELHAVDSK